MKKRYWPILVVACVLVVVLLFPACAKPVPAPTPTPAPMPTPAPAPAPTPTPTPTPAAAPAKPIKLKFSFAAPTRDNFYTDGFAPWAEQVKQRTTAIGKPVEIVFFGGAALGSVSAQYELTKTGITDISALWNPAEHPGIFPLSDILNLPFVVQESEVAGLIAQELYDTYPAFKKEFDDAGVKIIGFHPPVGWNLLITRARQVKTMEDLKGAKVSCVGMVGSQTVSALGGVPVMLAPPDVYMALERGLIEATFTCGMAISTFKFNEVTKYRTILPVGVFLNPLVAAMNPDSFNMLPPEVQKVFNELTGAYMTKLMGEAMDRVEAREYNNLVAYDKKVGNPEHYFLPDNEFKRWVEATKPVPERLIAELEAKGLPGKAFYQETLRLREKYSR